MCIRDSYWTHVYRQASDEITKYLRRKKWSQKWSWSHTTCFRVKSRFEWRDSSCLESYDSGYKYSQLASHGRCGQNRTAGMGPAGYNEKQCIFVIRTASVVRLRPLESRHFNPTFRLRINDVLAVDFCCWGGRWIRWKLERQNKTSKAAPRLLPFFLSFHFIIICDYHKFPFIICYWSSRKCDVHECIQYML